MNGGQIVDLSHATDNKGVVAAETVPFPGGAASHRSMSEINSRFRVYVNRRKRNPWTKIV